MFRKVLSSLITVLLITLAVPSFASDFDWMKTFNIRAEADQDGVKLRLGSSFKVGDADVDVVWSNTKSPADAFSVLALAEISDRPIRDVLSVYQQDRNTGWGNMARRLGIKPGSAEFKALKNGSYGNPDAISSGTSISIQFSSGQTAGKNNGKGKNK